MKLTIPTLRKLISEDIKKIINEAEGEAPPAEPKKNVSYTGVVLDRASHESLKSLVPEGWDDSKTRHHCTLTMGPWKGDASLLGQEVTMKVLGFVKDDKVAAVKVELPSGYVAKGTPHVTVATGQGGKPFLAGKLDYSKMEQPDGMPATLTGVVREVSEGDYSLAEMANKGGDQLLERWQRLAGLLK